MVQSPFDIEPHEITPEAFKIASRKIRRGAGEPSSAFRQAPSSRRFPLRLLP
jgi:hypothetical protein